MERTELEQRNHLADQYERRAGNHTADRATASVDALLAISTRLETLTMIVHDLAILAMTPRVIAKEDFDASAE